MSPPGGPSRSDDHEFELKARWEEEPEALRDRLVRTGWRRVFSGQMWDRRYDTPARRLEADDVVLRLRRWREVEDGGTAGASVERAVLAWKGPAATVDRFKVREELEVPVGEFERAARILGRLGFSEVTMAIDRRVDVFRKGPVSVRIEEYPRMDVLVELEGPPDDVEARIPELGLSRDSWRPWPLAAFVERFEQRTGQRARLAEERA